MVGVSWGYGIWKYAVAKMEGESMGSQEMKIWKQVHGSIESGCRPHCKRLLVKGMVLSQYFVLAAETPPISIQP